MTEDISMLNATTDGQEFRSRFRSFPLQVLGKSKLRDATDSSVILQLSVSRS